jgi:OOP family OmpA-OmpF porin
MNKKWLAAMLGAAAMAVSAGAVAQQADTGWYAGAQIGNAEVFDEDDTAWKVFGGYQINRTFSAELGYTNLGEVDVPGGSAEATAFELLGVGKFPLANQFSIYGLVGFAMVEVDVSGPFSNLSDDSTELTYGIGAQYDFSRNMGVRLQWQRYDTEEEVDVMSVGVVIKF